ncbi:MAG: hypothetical protein R6U26_03890 [Candidatus Undinarchaeales archaeon]
MNLRNNKGWMRVIEVGLAAILIFAFFVFISQTQFQASEENPDWDRVILKNYARDSLRTLDLKDENTDGRSDLRKNIQDGSWSSIESDFENLLPDNTDFILYIYANSTSTRKAGASASDLPEQREVITTYYPIAGDYGSFCSGGQPCSLILAVWFNQ